MLVGDILRKKTPRVVTVRMNETVGIAAKLMRANNISALVVKDVVRSKGNTAVGMFTERDVVRAVADRVAVMDSGRVVETGTTAELFAHPRAETTRKFVSSVMRTVPQEEEPRCAWGLLQQNRS